MGTSPPGYRASPTIVQMICHFFWLVRGDGLILGSCNRVRSYELIVPRVVGVLISWTDISVEGIAEISVWMCCAENALSRPKRAGGSHID